MKGGVSMSLAPSLALGGFSSIFITKGLYATYRGLQQAYSSGMDMLLPAGPEVNVVPDALRAQRRSVEHIMRMQRKGGSCGCLLLTATGIFYVQPVNLWVFKASPWGLSGSETLEMYQQQKTRLCAKAMAMYKTAIGTSENSSEEEVSNECSHLLLHMMLSDIQNIARRHFSNNSIDNFDIFKRESLQLIGSVGSLRNSTAVLSNWKPSWALWASWLRLLPEDTAFYIKSLDTPADSESILGIKNWTSVPGFSIQLQRRPEPDFWNSKPDIEQENGKWANLGRMRYAITAA
jgi:hypothetical protein